jgi:MATE family multidrug resistance protein
MFPFLAFLVLRSFLAALERPFLSVAVVVVAFLFNIAANNALMLGAWGFPALGLPGSGLATLLSTLLMFGGLAAVVSLDRRFRRYHLFGRLFRPDWPRFRSFWKLGLPIGATLAFEVTIFNAAVFLMGLIGATALAAHSIAIQIASLTFMVPLGIAQAVTVRVGLGFGAQDPEAITRAGWAGFVLGTGFMMLTALAMIGAPNLLISVFLDLELPQNRPVVALAISFLAIAALFQIADGAQVVGAGMLRGLHDTRVPMAYAALGYWGVGLPLGALLAFGTPLQGIGQGSALSRC